MSGGLEGLDNAGGQFAVIWLIPGIQSQKFTIYDTIGLSRWATREHAERYADYRRAPDTRVAVLDWGDDLLTDGRVVSCPELAGNVRVRAALGLAP